MLTPSDREIAQFFENLSPEDFAKTPTETHLLATTEDRVLSGPEDFERFMLDNLKHLIDEGEGYEVAILHDGTTARLYQQRPNEGAGPWLTRVARDAKEHSATWVFLGVPGEAAVGNPDTMFNPANADEVERARERGDLLQVTNWYVESVEPGHEEFRFGVLIFEDDDVRIVQSTNTTGVNPAFQRVLRS